MQNIPGIALEKATEQLKAVKHTTIKRAEQQTLFTDLFDKHSERIENELALTSVVTEEKMLDVAPETGGDQSVVSHTADTVTPVREERVEKTVEAPAERDRDQDRKMTQEDLDQVRDDLKEYGMTEEEIAEIEEEINSEEGMTWGEFVSLLSEKMAAMHKVELSGEQKGELGSFFTKFGFSGKESAQLIAQLEKGDTASVMAALKGKIEGMPDDKRLLFSKGEIEAFTSAIGFSKEFSAKIREVFGQGTMVKEMKETFTMIRQELAEMDQKDTELVRAVGRAFVSAMKDNHKETSAAREVAAAVDLKPRVAEESPRGATKEDLKEAADKRRELQKNGSEPSQTDVGNQASRNDVDKHWNNFFSKLQDDSDRQKDGSFSRVKTGDIESSVKIGQAEPHVQSKEPFWEKISAPKVMRQVESAFIKTLKSGAKQLTLQLTPENLGKLRVMLQVNGKEVRATIKAESHDAARIIADNVDVIKNALENQGLKVDKLEVQTGLTNNESFENWFGKEEHNLAREREMMVAMRAHMKQMREENAGLAQEMQNVREQAIYADQRLHVIA